MKYFNKDGTRKDNFDVSMLNSNEYMDFIRENHLINKRKIQIIKKQNITNTFVVNPNADNRLYYFRFIFKNNFYYKLGITSQTLKERYGSEYNKIDKILYDEKIDNAIKIERELKLKYKDDIFPLKYFNNGGHTEIFDRDILELDKN